MEDYIEKRIAELDAELNSFRQAATHVTENGKTTRSLSRLREEEEEE